MSDQKTGVVQQLINAFTVGLLPSGTVTPPQATAQQPAAAAPQVAAKPITFTRAEALRINMEARRAVRHSLD